MLKYLKKYDQLFELHYTDVYPQGFIDFRKKWNKNKKNAYTYQYYVQFTNNKDNNIDKSSYEHTDHSAAKGTYGYPLSYVIDYPSDIWYGKNAKFLRVLESKAKSILFLTTIKDREDCASHLSDCFKGRISEMEDMMKSARREHKSRVSGSNTWAKTFFQCIQFDYEEGHERTSKQQTELLIKGGWDAVLDDSRSINSAIINDREPNQIIFLKSTSFDVVDVFNLTEKEEINKQLITPSHDVVLGRKWASKILNVLDGDKIKEKGQDRSNTWFYSVGGREIILTFEQRDTSYRDNIKLGQKRHKAHKLYDDYSTQIKIYTEYGDIYTRVYEDDKFDDVLLYISHKWEDIKQGEIVEGWEKRTRERREAIEKEEQSKYFDEQAKKKAEKYKEKFNEWKPRIEFWNEKANADFKFMDLKRMQKYMEDTDSLDFRIGVQGTKEQTITNVNKHYDDIVNDGDMPDIMMSMFFGGDTEEDYKNVEEYRKIILKIAEIANENRSFIEYTFWNYDKK